MCSRAANSMALVLLLEAIESSLRGLALFGGSLLLRHGLVEVLCQDLVFLQVRDVTRTVVRQFPLATVDAFLTLLAVAKPLGLTLALMQLVLLFFNVVHELLDVFERI